jgi:type I restriction enzyme S subunit
MEVKKGYKQTEVGMIPEDWEAVPIGNIFEFKNGLNKAKEYFGKGTPIVNYMDVFNNTGLLKKEVGGKVTLTTDEIRNYQVKKGDVFFTRTSETVEEIGMSSVLLEDITDAVFSGFVLRGRPKNDMLTLLYKQYCFRSKEVRKQICSTSSYTTRALTNGKLLSNVYIPVPPTITEQTAVATALSDADALIQSLEKLIAKKRNIKQGAMQELLKPKEGWVVKKLGDVAVLKARIGWQGLTTAEYKETGDYFLITGTDFKNGFIDWENCVYVDSQRYKQDKNIQVKENDVLVTKDGTIGKVAFIKKVPKPATLNSGVFVIRPIEQSFHPEFFYYLLLSKHFTIFLSQLSAGSTINHLYQKDFVSFEFQAPKTIKEQTRIAAILSDMDAEISALENTLAKYKQIKQGMMQELLTGKTRLV